MFCEMVAFRECKKILGKKYEHLSDEQIKGIRDWCNNTANLLLKILEREQKAENDENSQEDSNHLGKKLN